MHIRILHVCGEENNIFRSVRILLEELLIQYNHPNTYEIEGAKAGCDIIEVFNRFGPDFNVILFYIRTCTDDGIKLLKIMNHYNPKIPVLLYSASKTKEYHKKMITDYGAFDAFNILFKLTDLQKKVDKAALWNAKQVLSAKQGY